jgi:hypothetical protein
VGIRRQFPDNLSTNPFTVLTDGRQILFDSGLTELLERNQFIYFAAPDINYIATRRSDGYIG